MSYRVDGFTDVRIDQLRGSQSAWSQVETFSHNRDFQHTSPGGSVFTARSFPLSDGPFSAESSAQDGYLRSVATSTYLTMTAPPNLSYAEGFASAYLTFLLTGTGTGHVTVDIPWSLISTRIGDDPLRHATGHSVVEAGLDGGSGGGATISDYAFFAQPNDRLEQHGVFHLSRAFDNPSHQNCSRRGDKCGEHLLPRTLPITWRYDSIYQEAPIRY